MPEGDTIARTAATLERWLGGREVTAARSQVRAVPAPRLVGDRIATVEARGKHLLMRFDSGCVLHTHMRMEGSWHVYRAGEAWRRPARQGRLVIEAGPRVAVCFNAPVIELLAARGEKVHPALMALGPDVLAPGGPDLIEVRARVAAQPPDTLIGDVLLDQRLMAGIGNIYRCETLFLHGVHPDRPLASVDADLLDAIVVTASQLMTANITAARRSQTWVYGRTGRPCRRCGRAIVSTRVGTQARTAYWCRRCQPAP